MSFILEPHDHRAIPVSHFVVAPVVALRAGQQCTKTQQPDIAQEWPGSVGTAASWWIALRACSRSPSSPMVSSIENRESGETLLT
jgi:hypothetical protein